MIWGVELSDLTTSAYTARCIMYRSTGNASSMHVWLAGYPYILLPLWNAKSQIRSLVCTLRNSNIAITSLVCTLRNSKSAIQMIIQITHFALVWKQSSSLKGENCCVIADDQFLKSQKIARFPGTTGSANAMDKSHYSGYITRHWNWMNNYKVLNW